jgi:ABC-type glycerol-3-phosphate transport system permease component
MILTQSNNDIALPSGLSRSGANSRYGKNVPVVMAIVLFSIVPILVLYVGPRHQLAESPWWFPLR